MSGFSTWIRCPRLPTLLVKAAHQNRFALTRLLVKIDHPLSQMRALRQQLIRPVNPKN